MSNYPRTFFFFFFLAVPADSFHMYFAKIRVRTLAGCNVQPLDGNRGQIYGWVDQDPGRM